MNAVSTSSTAGHGGSSTTNEFCGHCGKTFDVGAPPPSSAHRTCEELLQLEPPRYCAACRRRMKVQVTPLGWTAECSRHGVLAPFVQNGAITVVDAIFRAGQNGGDAVTNRRA